MEVALKSERRLAPWLKHVNMMSPLCLRLRLTTNHRRRHCTVDGHDHRAVGATLPPPLPRYLTSTWYLAGIYLTRGWRFDCTSSIVMRGQQAAAASELVLDLDQVEQACIGLPLAVPLPPGTSSSGTACGGRLQRARKDWTGSWWKMNPKAPHGGLVTAMATAGAQDGQEHCRRRCAGQTT